VVLTSGAFNGAMDTTTVRTDGSDSAIGPHGGLEGARWHLRSAITAMEQLPKESAAATGGVGYVYDDEIRRSIFQALVGLEQWQSLDPRPPGSLGMVA